MARADSKDFTLEKGLPSNLEAERAILGAILLDNSMINQAAERLRREDFFLDSHRRIYEQMILLYEGGRAIDPITLQESLRRSGDLELIGGPAYVASLFDGVPRFANIDNYTKIVKDKAILRRLITASNQIMSTCFDDEDEAEMILDNAERMILSIGEERIKQGFVPISEVAKKQLEYIEEIAGREQLITGVATGFTDLDFMTSGLQRGDLIIIAARPSMGKCLAADSEIVLADGSLVTIEEIYRRQQANLLTLGDNFRFRLTSPSAYIDDGVKPVYQVTTRLGRSVTSTATHPFLTVDGWRQLGELRVGDRIAVPRRIEVFGTEQLGDGQVKVLAYLIGDGNLTRTTPSFTNSNPRLQEDFAAAVSEFPGLKVWLRDDGQRTPTQHVAGDFDYLRSARQEFASKLRKLVPRGAARTLAGHLSVSPSLISIWRQGECTPRPELFSRLCETLNVSPQLLAPHGLPSMSRSRRNPLTTWLAEIGIWGCSASQKAIPDVVFRLTRSQIALFLNRLFATDGWVAISAGQNPAIGYSSVSERLARQVQHLLLRFGIIGRLRKRSIKYQTGRRPAWQIDITHAASIRTFAAEIGLFGKEEKLERALTLLAPENNRNNRDLIPIEAWEQVAESKGEESWLSLAKRAGLKGCSNIHVGRRALSRHRLASMARALGDDYLQVLAESDLYWDEIVSIEYLGEKQVYDLTVPETHNFVANDICVHNTALCLNIAQNAATRPQFNGRKAVVGIFSLEMSKEQLVHRLLCSQARIDAHRLRSGMLNKDDWKKLAYAVSELAEAQIFLDDTPGINVLEMRAKTRRLRNEQKALDLLIVDYLQLMSGRGRNESRQQEVSQISRELKILAKELDVPLIALSQLSRAPEARTGNRPQLSDLRESGCLAGESLVTMAETGERIPIRDLVGRSGFRVWALNEATMRIEPATVSRAFTTGLKLVYRLTTRLGRTIRATANHKFRALAGWRRLDELRVGDRLAMPRRLPSPAEQTMSDAELALLGHLIGDGCTLPRHAIQYTTREKDLAEIVAELARQVFGSDVDPRVKQERTWYQVYLSSTRHHTHGVRNCVSEWLSDLGVWGLRSYEKRIPDRIFTQPAEAIGLFLRHLWATDGCVRLKPGFYPPAVYYSSSSEQLSRHVQALLLRLGINAWLRRRSQNGKGRDQFHVSLSGSDEIRQFANMVGAVGQYKQQGLKDVLGYLEGREAKTNRDVIPSKVWSHIILPAMEQKNITDSQLAERLGLSSSRSNLYSQNLSRTRALRVEKAIESTELVQLAESDLYWDQIISIEEDGMSEVFDLTVPGHANFEVEGLTAHNSIEQDADIVMFIYREDVYKPDTEKQNIAEIIIGKQRNGPTGSVELVFLKQLTRFEDKFRE